MTAFQRARSDEQREERRRVILATAGGMLAEMPVSAMSLNELSRRVGLAKSNVLRYFESREAVLLELLDSQWRRWLDELPDRMATGIDRRGPVERRADQLAATLTESLRDRPVFCDLLSAQAGVLERNVSPEVAARYKRSTIGDVHSLARLIRQHLPELDDRDALRLCAAAVMTIGALWTYSRPSASMAAAYAADPGLAVMAVDFADSLRDILSVLTSGILARPAR